MCCNKHSKHLELRLREGGSCYLELLVLFGDDERHVGRRRSCSKLCQHPASSKSTVRHPSQIPLIPPRVVSIRIPNPLQDHQRT